MVSLFEVKRTDRGKWLINLTENWSTLGSYSILWPLLSKGILHTREAASVLPKYLRPHSIPLCSRQLLTAGSAALYLRTFPRSTEDGSACVSGSLEASLGKCPGINTVFMRVSLNQLSRSQYSQLKRIDQYPFSLFLPVRLLWGMPSTSFPEFSYGINLQLRSLA